MNVIFNEGLNLWEEPVKKGVWCVVGEFGCANNTTHADSLRFLESSLRLFDEMGMVFNKVMANGKMSAEEWNFSFGYHFARSICCGVIQSRLQISFSVERMARLIVTICAFTSSQDASCWFTAVE